MVFTISRKALTQVPCSAGPCTQLPVCIASLLLLMPSSLHGEDPRWEKAKVLSLVLQVSRPRIAGSVSYTFHLDVLLLRVGLPRQECIKPVKY